MTLSTVPVVGAPDETHWPQVFQHSVDDRNFMAAFCFANGNDARVTGKAFVDHLQKLPFDDLTALCTKLRELVERAGDMLQSFAAALFVDENVYLWCAKGGSVHLKRLEKHGLVLKSDVLKVVSGKLRSSDVYVCGTSEFFRLIPDPCRLRLQQAEDIADEAMITVQQHMEQSKVAAYIVQIEESREKAVEAKREPLIEQEKFVKQETPFFFSRLRQLRPRLPRSPQSRRLLRISIVLIGVFLTLVVWGTVRSVRQQKRIQAMIAPMEQTLVTAKSKQQDDLPTARSLAKQALESAKGKAAQFKPKTFERKKLDAFVIQTQLYYDSISGEKHLESLPIFYNLQLVKQSFLAKRMTMLDDAILFLDPEENSVISLKMDTKQSAVLNTDGVSESRDIATTGKRVYVLGDGVYEEGKVLIQKGDSWQDPAFIRAFGSSVYVLDRGSRALYKYASTNGEFSSSPTNWIKSAVGLDFSIVNSLSIDGKVWITTKKGEIFAFAQGTKALFSVQHLDLPLAGSIVLYTTDTLQHLYILDTSGNRVVMLDKNGAYQRQWFAKELGAATDLVVAVDEKTAFVSSGSVVYSINLE